MMKISIIIVNYNVEYFLEQCLHSVFKALKNISSEVIVVDNNSVDGSLAMIRKKFPQVILIENNINVGFSRANNQAIKISQGEYVLLLNPDTVVEEDTFQKTLHFMDANDNAGALGVKMLDGKGFFLPESKRGLPTPSVAFYKIFGFSKVFPKSKKFGKYHLSYLNNEQINDVDVLSGAFMLIRKLVLNKIGLLDEDFFMYGEDIDLSYRIQKSGFKNYYFPLTRIIHYKGESTKKSSANYVFVFYNAMSIFAKKHFSQNNAALFTFFINAAIYVRASISILKIFVKNTLLPFFDASIILIGLLVLKIFYERNVKFTDGGTYEDILVWTGFSAYTIIWLLAVFFSGGYDKPIRLIKVLKGVFIGTGFILIIYSLLPEFYRFSRALIILGTIWALLALTINRVVLHFLKIKGFELNGKLSKRIAIIGSANECLRVNQLLEQTTLKANYIKYISIEANQIIDQNLFIGKYEQLSEIITIYKIDELIFCAQNISAQNIINSMLQLGNLKLDYKIAPPESLSVIGSSSINTSGDLYVIDINSVNKPINKRNKRLFDITLSLSLLITLPINILFFQKKLTFIKNLIKVFSGQLTWIGYDATSDFPSGKKGVLKPALILSQNELNFENERRANLIYVKDYSVMMDIRIVLKNFRKLSN